MRDLVAEYDDARKVYQRYADPEEARRLADDRGKEVAEWRWASDPMVEDPFDRERYQLTRSRWISEDKVASCQGVKHGLDVHGEVVVTWNPWFHDRYDKKRAQSGFFWREGSCALRVEFGAVGLNERPERATRLSYDSDGQLVRKAVVWRSGGYAERFEWACDKLLRIVVTRWAHNPCPSGGDEWKRGKVTRRTEERFTYDDRGRIEGIVSFELDSKERQVSDGQVMFRRAQKGESMSELSAAITASLLEQVPAAIRSAKLAGRFYCLLLGYTEEDFTAAWPPFLVLGSEVYLKRTVARGEELPYYMWAPDELRLLPENVEIWLSNENLRTLCASHARMMAMRGSTITGRRVVREVARALNDIDWSAILEPCDDFVVAAVENTGQRDPAKEVKGTVPKGVYKSLRSRRLI